MIILKNVNKSFGDKTVLKDIDLKVQEGKIFGLLGPSGSGKTTIINIMIGKIKDFSGELSILGRSKHYLNDKSFKRMFGMMSDSSSAYSRLTIEENLLFFASIYDVKRCKVTNLLKKLSLYSHRKEIYKNISKGMKQRVLLGIALINNPKLVILDEPTSALDPQTTEKIYKFLEELKKRGTTIFLTTHDMEEAERLCDEISILYKGEIKKNGNPKKILKREKKIIVETSKNRYYISSRNDLHYKLKDVIEKEIINDIDVEQSTLRNDFLEITRS